MTDDDFDPDSAIAIIGMSGRFPGAGSVEAFWDNQVAGRPGLRPVTDDELASAGISPGLLADPSYVRVAAPLDDIDLFDAAFFGLSRREAETMDPQHRLFLECAWEAVESAGYPPAAVPGRVGVFAGCGYPDYGVRVQQRYGLEPGGALLMAIGNERDSLSSMVSYKLDLRGPSVTVQTFCSTSLVAVHLAAQSLLTFESDLAIAGGAYIALPQPAGYLFEEGGIASPDGAVRSFDAAARGTILGNGVAVVALKRLTAALADRDPVHAMILGSAINNDGRACAGYTAPGVDGQAEVIELALGVAGVKSETIGYVECHATGTVLGDSIELAALRRAFPRRPPSPCVLGALKPSVGHLDRASGVTGLIRATLALRNAILPATPGFQNANPTLAQMQDRFTVLTEAAPWTAGGHPRRAGVSSFGFGGTNAHVVLQEAPRPAVTEPSAGPHLLVLSTRDSAALQDGIHLLRRHLDLHPDVPLADVAYTLQQSRAGFPCRWAVVCRDHADALAATADPSRWFMGETDRHDVAVAVRLPEGAEPSHPWWPELTAAADRTARSVTSAGRADGEGAGPAVAARAVVDALRRVGVRMLDASTATDDPARVELRLHPPSTSAEQWLVASLARLWLAGVAVDWAALHSGPRRRVPLPTYAFQRRRYWIEADRQPARPADGGKLPDPARWTYLPAWRRRHDEFDDLNDRIRAAGPWLVAIGEDCGHAMVRQLREIGADVVVVRPGSGYARTGSSEFVVRPDSAEDLDELTAALALSPRTVVHALSLTPVNEEPADPVARFDHAQSRGWYAVLALMAALGRRSGMRPEELLLLTDGAIGVTETDLRHPEHATIGALAPVLAQENPTLRARHVDVDAGEQIRGGHVASLARRVLSEAVSPFAGTVAWRGGQRWVRSYEPLPLPDVQDGSPVANGSTVLITGGLGNVGLALASHLGVTRGCRLILTSRSPLPPRASWAEGLRTLDPSDRLARRLRTLLMLDERGVEVMTAQVDMADAGALAAVVRAAEERFGAIDTVVHGAGAQEAGYFGLVQDADRSVCQAHFAAKVHGFLNLQRALSGRRVRHRITLSSLSAVLGGITLGPYAAANAALDAYALAARQQAEGNWLTVNWDAWRIEAAAEGAARSSVTAFELDPREGAELFERVLAVADRIGHLAVSTGRLDDRIEQWVIGPASGARDGGDRDVDQDRDPRPDLPTAYVAPATETETTLARLWADALRLDTVGVDDDFYLLGGDSIVAIKLIATIRDELGIALPVTVLLEYPSVRALAQRLGESE